MLKLTTMAAPDILAEQQFPPQDLAAYIPPDIDWDAVRERDQAMIAELQRLNSRTPPVRSLETGLDYACGELAGLVRREYDTDSIAALEAFLAEHGTLDIPVVEGYSITVDGQERRLSLVAATEMSANGANHGEMSTMLYLRDQIQAASALIKLHTSNPAHYAAERATGKALLLSALHLMSTPSQLERFEDVIRRGPAAGQADWPQISLYFDDLEGARPNGWRNKQDSLQMLAYAALEAIEAGVLDPAELSTSHKRCLSLVTPLLAAVGFPGYESSGTWEEVAARRSSVMAIETALLHKMRAMAVNREDMGFLHDVRLEDMIRNGLHELGSRLPDESDDYDPQTVKYREADAALVYVLRYGLPQLMADEQVPMAANKSRPMDAEAIEHLVLDQLESLIDPRSNGISRYNRDSYQGANFHTDSVQLVIRAIKHKVRQDAIAGNGETDLDTKQALRDSLTPAGWPAAWTHPLGQIASWAASRWHQAASSGNREAADRYRTTSYRYLNRMLSTVTGNDQWHAVRDANGHYRIKQVTAYRLPECNVTYTIGDSRFCVPSPHTPLNWSTAMLREAIGMVQSPTP